MTRRVLLVQPSLQPPGGGNGVAAWTLQALAAEHDVTVLSWRRPDVAAIDRFFGTSLAAVRFDARVVPMHWRMASDYLPVPAALLRSGLLMRHARRLVDRFDVVIGLHNEADYGRPGIQYIHYPAYLRPRPAVDLRWYHRWPPALKAYYAVADRLAGFSLDRMKANLTLANSNWTAARVYDVLGLDARTVYPPVVAGAAPLPWAERRRGVLAIGRLSPEKDYERILRIVARVRRHVSGLTLTIVGTTDRAGRGYYHMLRTLAASLDPSGAWVSFRENVSRDDVRALIATHRYGLHAMREEHFGMAPAEMVRGGMIVWVPRGGGAPEIVGDAPRLTYDTEDEAVERMLSVMGDAALEGRLRDELAVQGEQFAAERFVREMREVVAAFPRVR